MTVASLVVEEPQKITVTLIRESMDALVETAALLGFSLTDTLNRALQMYAYVEKVQSEGGQILVREKPGADIELLKIS